MVKKIGFWLLVVLFLGVLAYGYFYINALKKPKTTAINAIPDDCIFLSETNDFFKLWKKLNETNMIWQELQQFPFISELRETAYIADSMFFSDEASRKVLEGNKIYLAAFDTDGDKEYLYALNVNLEHAENVIAFLKRVSVSPEQIKTASGENAWKFGLKTGKGILYLYQKDGLVVFSKSLVLVEKSIACTDKNCIGKDPYFLRVADIAGSAADFRFYLNLGRSGELYHQYLAQNSFFETAAEKEGERGWAEVDLDFTPNEMKLNGFSLPDSSSLLSYLAKQKPVEIKFIHNVPQSTDNFLFIGLSDFRAFYDSVEKNVLLTEEQKMHEGVLSEMSAKTGFDLRDKVLDAVGNEIVALRVKFADTLQFRYCAVHLNDREEEEKDFHLIADSVIRTTIKVNEEEANDSIYYFNNANLIPALTCGLVKGNFHYCFFYEDYLVFCEGKNQWAKYIDEVSKGKVLAKNEDFERFRKGNVSEDANLFMYSFFSSSADFIPGYLAEEVKQSFQKHSELLNKFHSAGFQMAAYKNLLLTQGYLLYSPIYHRSNRTVWEVKLDTAAVMPPTVVLNHKSGLEEIVTQDAADNIYLISNTGKILWKRKLDGRLKSNVFQVDLFQNNKLQLVFNTATTLYMMDRNGKDIEGYPVKLKVPATNGISVFDYEKNRDYRIVYFSEDNKMNVLKGNGKHVDGFSFPGTEDSVKTPVKWERVNFRDYLISVDMSGNVYGVGRKGEKRLNITEKFNADGLGYVVEYGKDIDKTRFVYYDGSSKKIKNLFLNNKLKETEIPTGLEDPAYFFAKINEDDYYDLILIEGRNIEVYDDQGNLLQKLNWNENLKPLFRKINKNGETLYAFVDEKDNLLLIPVSWQLPEVTSIKCTHLPAIEKLNDDGYYYLVGIHDDLVSCYPF